MLPHAGVVLVYRLRERRLAEPPDGILEMITGFEQYDSGSA
jgi:hypothetical protein